MPEWQSHRVMLPGRWIAVALLGAALLQPPPVTHQEPTLLALVEAQRGANLDGHLDALPGGQPITTKMFGGSGTEASLPAVFRAALQEVAPVAGSAIVIAARSELPAALEPLLERSTSAGLPVFWLPLADEQAAARITAIDAPHATGAGQQFSVSVSTEIPADDRYGVVLYANARPVGRSAIHVGRPTVLTVTAPDSGTMRLGAELVYDGETVARLQTGAVVNVFAPPALLAVATADSPFANSLAAGGWQVTRVAPSGFAAVAPDLGRYGALILDDVAADAIPRSAWAYVSDAVQRDAMGLIVLGGDNSFALGAYRDSLLEELLPLVSEPPRSEQPASIEFLVDVSGSMASGGTDTLRVARDAVLETAAALRPVDRTGLVTFDVSARPLLSMSARDDHREAILAAWPDRASGGTSLLPALQEGMASLESETSELKLLMVVTDGMLSEEDLARLDVGRVSGGIELVVLIVDPSSDHLERIAASRNATVLRVGNVLRLPQLMRDELEQRRNSIATGTTRPEVRAAVPFLDANAWPALNAYAVTRAKADATVMLAAPDGSALLAGWTAGAGRVVALTGGLAEWAPAWLRWHRWPEFASSLASYAAVRDVSDLRQVQAGNAITVDTPATHALPARAVLVGPRGDGIDVGIQPIAPRRYQVGNRRPAAGAHTLLWESGAQMHRYVVGVPDRTAGTLEARRLVDEGLLRQWSPATRDELRPPGSYRSALLVAALLVFLATMIAERVPVQKR